jgi:hypothetical protein
MAALGELRFVDSAGTHRVRYRSSVSGRLANELFVNHYEELEAARLYAQSLGDLVIGPS